MIVYHGTSWAFAGEDESFLDLSPDYSDDEAIYVSESEKVALYFADRSSTDPDTDTLVLFRCELASVNSYVHLARSSRTLIEVSDTEYTLDDRKALYDALRVAGYDAFVTPQNYGANGSDMAILRSDCLVVESAKVKFPGVEWSDWMSPEAARRTYLSRWGSEDDGE